MSRAVEYIKYGFTHSTCRRALAALINHHTHFSASRDRRERYVVRNNAQTLVVVVVGGTVIQTVVTNFLLVLIIM